MLQKFESLNLISFTPPWYSEVCGSPESIASSLLHVIPGQRKKLLQNVFSDHTFGFTRWILLVVRLSRQEGGKGEEWKGGEKRGGETRGLCVGYLCPHSVQKHILPKLLGVLQTVLAVSFLRELSYLNRAALPPWGSWHPGTSWCGGIKTCPLLLKLGTSLKGQWSFRI